MSNKPEKKGSKPLQASVLERFNAHFAAHEQLYLWLSLSLGALMCILMFDCKVSLSGDDCDYVLGAKDLYEKFRYPGMRGALYPMFLTLFMPWGLHLILFKTFSAVFIMLSMWFMYKALKDKIPAAVLFPVLLIVNVCPYIFFYACYTYSEPLFMLTQSLFIYCFSKYFIVDDADTTLPLTTNWKKYVYISLCILAMGLTRTIGYAVVGGVALYFCMRKQWRNLLYSAIVMIAVSLLYDLVKKLLWPDAGAPYGFTNYLAKNFYNPEMGMEDFPGMVRRFVENSHIYLSTFFFKFVGFRAAVDEPLPNKPVLTIFLYLLYIALLPVVYKRSKLMFFVGIYAGMMNVISFVLLQAIWGQDRLIMIYYPLMLVYLFAGIYYFFSSRKASVRWVYIALLAVVSVGTLIHAKAKVGRNLPVLQANLAGNDLYGLTPDWENFVLMCRWANKNLPQDAVVCSRKPSISYIYTGRNFAGLFSVPNETFGDVSKDYDETDKEKFVYVAIFAKQVIQGIHLYNRFSIVPRNEAELKINGQKVSHAKLYCMPKELFDNEAASLMTANGIVFTTDIKAFMTQFANADQSNYHVTNPDHLLEVLLDAKIDYLVLPRIRLYTYYNTGLFVNTLHQFVSFISDKYPGLFKVIHTIGKDEICELAEFNNKAFKRDGEVSEE